MMKTPICVFDSPQAVGRVFRKEAEGLSWFIAQIETGDDVVTVRAPDGCAWFPDESSARSACLAEMAGLAIRYRALVRSCLPALQESLLSEDSPFA